MEGERLSIVPPDEVRVAIEVHIFLVFMAVVAFNMAEGGERRYLFLFFVVVLGWLWFDIYRHLTRCEVWISDDHLHLSGRRGECKVPLEWVVDLRSRFILLGGGEPDPEARPLFVWQRGAAVMIYVRLARPCRYGRTFHFCAATHRWGRKAGAETIDEIWSRVAAKRAARRANSE